MFIGREFPIHNRERCACQSRGTACALGCSAFKGIRRWVPLSPTCWGAPASKETGWPFNSIPCLWGNVSQEKLAWCLLDVTVISLIARRGCLEQPRHIYNCLTQLSRKRSPLSRAPAASLRSCSPGPRRAAFCWTAPDHSGAWGASELVSRTHHFPTST